MLTVCTKYVVGAWVFLGYCGCYPLSLLVAWSAEKAQPHIFDILSVWCPFHPFLTTWLHVLRSLMHGAGVRLHMIDINYIYTIYIYIKHTYIHLQSNIKLYIYYSIYIYTHAWYECSSYGSIFAFASRFVLSGKCEPRCSCILFSSAWENWAPWRQPHFNTQLLLLISDSSPCPVACVNTPPVSLFFLPKHMKTGEKTYWATAHSSVYKGGSLPWNTYRIKTIQ